MNTVNLIRKKRHGYEHNREELKSLINAYTKDTLPEYQMAAWVMAVCFQGLSDTETSLLTQFQRDSGKVMNFSHLPAAIVDKHSTGGVGDKTSLILGPIAAAAGIYVPMIAGRGLGHTGGTLDKLESLPGFQVDLDLQLFQNNVEKHGLAIIGQTKDICPADKKLYALRDVTGTIDSLPLICASIMSKKLAEGLNALVLDVKFGSGAFMKTLGEAEQLAQNLQTIGHKHGVQVAALLSDMNQPLGRYIGNALEVKECLDILKGEIPETGLETRTRQLSLTLAGCMIYMGGQADTPELGYKQAEDLLNSGQAFEKFMEMARAQGAKTLGPLPESRHQTDVVAENSGFIESFNTEQIGLASGALGAGRKVAEDNIDPAAGIEMHCQIGDKVQKGDVLFSLYSENETLFREACQYLNTSFKMAEQPPSKHPLVQKMMIDPPE